MKKLFGYILALILSTLALAETNSVQMVFKKNKVKLQKTETINGEQIYHVELPFDPSIGKNSNHLEAEISLINDCKSFTMLSEIDAVKIHVTAKKQGKTCKISENIEPTKH